MDLLKNPKITKAARGVVCLFAFIAFIGSMVSMFSSISLGSINSLSGVLKAESLADTISGTSGMALVMSILTMVFSLGTVVLAFFSMHNLAFSLAGAAGSVILFILGLIISPFTGKEWLGQKLGYSMMGGSAFPGGYIAVFILLILFAVAILGVNILGIIKDDRQYPVSNFVYQNAMQLNQKMMNKPAAPMQQPMNPQYQQPMNYQNQQYQQPMQAQPMQQPMNYQNQQYQQPMQGQPMQQPMNPQYQQPMQGQQAQPVQQPMNPQYQQPMQAQPVQPMQQPMMNQQYQQQAQPVPQPMQAQPVPQPMQTQPVPQPVQAQPVPQPEQQNDHDPQ